MKRALIISIILNLILIALLVIGFQSSVEPMPTPSTPDPIVYIPPSFTDAESARIRERVVEPYIAYSQCTGAFTDGAIRIDTAETPGFLYTFEAFTREGTNEGFLFGEPGTELDYFTPALILSDCVDTLPHADELRDQALDEYRG